MIILDTDHLSEYLRGDSNRGARLRGRIEASTDRPVFTPIITVEEQLRGRLAVIRNRKSGIDEVPAYEHLAQLIESYAKWTILPFDEASALLFDQLESQKIRIGSMDLRIASIVLIRGATLLSANLRDFRQVPGLQVEDWLRD
jgi:tRNA(fMet)-specific endonuclease VapC